MDSSSASTEIEKDPKLLGLRLDMFVVRGEVQRVRGTGYPPASCAFFLVFVSPRCFMYLRVVAPLFDGAFPRSATHCAHDYTVVIVLAGAGVVVGLPTT